MTPIKFQLFDPSKRLDLHFDVPQPGLSDWDYLNSSFRPSAIRIRDDFQRWFEQMELTGSCQDTGRRFQSSDNTHHLGAALEIVAFAICSALGLRPVRRDPFDLVVWDCEDREACVEVKYVDTRSPLAKRSSKHIDDLIRSFNKCGNLGCFFSIANEVITERLPIQEIVREYKVRAGRVSKSGNSESIRFGGRLHRPLLEVKLTRLPKSLQCRNLHSYLGISSGGVWREVRDIEVIKQVIKKKLNQHVGRQPDCPRIIILGVRCEFSFAGETSSWVECVYGPVQQEILISTMSGEIVGESTVRQRDGAYVTTRGFKNTSLAGVIFLPNFSPWNLRGITPVSFPHPKARYPFDLAELPIRSVRLLDEVPSFEVTEGQNVLQLLNLSKDWPGDIEAEHRALRLSEGLVL